MIDVMDMLERLNIDARPASGGTEANFSCPFHTDERPSAYMNLETSAWFCWSCKERGRSAVSFVAKIHGVPWATAQTWLHEAYGFDYELPHGSMVAELDAMFAELKPTVEFQPPPESWVSTFRVDYSKPVPEPVGYLVERGLEPSTLERWEVGYDMLSDRPVFAVRDHAGALMGFKGRAWKPSQEPRYLVLGDRGQVRYGFAPYEGTHLVFGLHRVEPGAIVLCEGELNVMALDQIGIPAVAIGMSYFSELHAQLILTKATHVTVFVDTDPAGDVARKSMIEKLEPYVPVRVVPPHEGDPMDLGQASRDLIFQARSTLDLTTVSR